MFTGIPRSSIISALYARYLPVPSHVRTPGLEWGNARAHTTLSGTKRISVRSKTGIISSKVGCFAHRIRRTRFRARTPRIQRCINHPARVHLSRLSNPGRTWFPEFISSIFFFTFTDDSVYLIYLLHYNKFRRNRVRLCFETAWKLA